MYLMLYEGERERKRNREKKQEKEIERGGERKREIGGVDNVQTHGLLGFVKMTPLLVGQSQRS